jgi:hypothetical protein
MAGNVISGSGYGYGYGYGDGYGDGSGDGSGYGSGYVLGSVAGYEVRLIAEWSLVRVGCEVHTIAHWRERWRQIAGRNKADVDEREVAALLACDTEAKP